MSYAFGYEWNRLKSLRSTWIVSIVVLAASMASGISLWFGPTSKSGGIDSRFFVSTLNFGAELTLVPLVAIPLAVAGVMTFGHDFRYGMIRLTLLVAPRRSTIFSARVIMMALWSLFIGIASVLCQFLVGLAGAWARMLRVDYSWPEFWRPVAAYLILLVLWCLSGVAVSCLTRSMAASIFILLAWPLLVERIIVVIVRSVSIFRSARWVASVLPFSAGQRSLQLELPPELERALYGSDMSAIPSLLLFAAVIAGMLAFALWALVRRDS